MTNLIETLEATATSRKAAYFTRYASYERDEKTGSMLLPLCDLHNERSPTNADRCAMGLVTYHLFRSESLIIPDLIEQPAWVEHHSPPGFPESKLKLAMVHAAFSAGYLKDKLARLSNPQLGALIEGLVTLRISSRSELEGGLNTF